MADSRSGPQTRPSLLVRLRDAHDPEAWQTFVDVYGPVLFRFCRRRGLQEADTHDVTQNVLAQVFQSIRRFEYDPKRGRFRDWLYVATRHEIARCSRKNERLGQGVGGDSDGALGTVKSPQQETEWATELNRRLYEVACQRARVHFEELTWQAFDMVWIQDLPAADVARQLNQKLEFVYVAKSRVLKRLREEVLELAEDASYLDAP